MAIIKKNELKQMNEKSIQEKMVELRRELIRHNAQVSMGTSPENPGKIREIKKTIARMLTLIKNKPKEEVKKV